MTEMHGVWFRTVTIYKIIFGVWDYMKLMKTTEAVGQVLCHDITQIIPGVKKDAVFRKGHIITKEDIPVLLSVGKTPYIYGK